MGLSNYPPGVTGREWQIAGCSAEEEDAYETYLETEPDEPMDMGDFLEARAADWEPDPDAGRD